MDLVLNQFDNLVGDGFYSACNGALAAGLAKGSELLGEDLGKTLLNEVSIGWMLERESIPRQLASLFVLTYLGIFFIYFGFAIASFYLIFDHRMMTHPRFLKNQIRREIKLSMDSFVPVDLMTLPWFLGDVRGHSKLYGSLASGPNIADLPFVNKLPLAVTSALGLANGGRGGMTGACLYMAVSAVGFLLFTDYLIYWVHRSLHHPILYKRLHKPHHRFIIPTPFASHAFHPLDGYANSLPYHIYCYLVPVHKALFIVLFVCVNLWTIFIHDSELITDSAFEHYINGPSHHSLHHLYFTVNYGQYFTYADKWGKSFRMPAKGEDPLIEILKAGAKRAAALVRERAGEAPIAESEASSSDIESDDDSGYESKEGVDGTRLKAE